MHPPMEHVVDVYIAITYTCRGVENSRSLTLSPVPAYAARFGGVKRRTSVSWRQCASGSIIHNPPLPVIYLACSPPKHSGSTPPQQAVPHFMVRRKIEAQIELHDHDPHHSCAVATLSSARALVITAGSLSPRLLHAITRKPGRDRRALSERYTISPAAPVASLLAPWMQQMSSAA